MNQIPTTIEDVLELARTSEQFREVEENGLADVVVGVKSIIDFLYGCLYLINWEVDAEIEEEIIRALASSSLITLYAINHNNRDVIATLVSAFYSLEEIEAEGDLF